MYRIQIIGFYYGHGVTTIAESWKGSAISTDTGISVGLSIVI